MITEDLIRKFIDTKKDKAYNCEFSLQFALAWFLKEYDTKNLNEIKEIEFESKIYKKTDFNKEYNGYCRCDIVVYKNNGTRILIELKYIVQDSGIKTSTDARKSFMKDLIRLNNPNNKYLESNNVYTNNDERFCIFITDKNVIYEKAENCKAESDLEKFNKTFGNPKSSFHKYWIDGIDTNWGGINPIRCLLVDAKNIDIELLETEYERYKPEHVLN